MGGREVGWVGSDRQERGERQTSERETGAKKARGEIRRRRQRRGDGRGGEEGAHTYTQAGRQKSKQERVKVKTITRGAGSVRLCAPPWKCQALCSLTVSCTRRPESAGSLTKTDSSN